MNRGLLTAVCMVLFSIGVQSQINWDEQTNVASANAGNNHPRIALDRAGNPMLVWYNASNAMFTKREGNAFESPRPLNSISMTVAGASWMGPDIASHGDTVYVVYKQTPEHTQHAWSIASYDGGSSFSAPVQLDVINDSLARFPTVTTDDAGNPVVGFMKFNNQFLEATWVVTRSYDFGKTFNSDALASKWSDPDAHVCDCCPGAIVSSGDNVVMLYRDNNDNIRDTWAGFSVDGGETFIAGTNVDQHQWLINACPSTGPDGVIIGDTLYSVFMNAASGKSVVYLGKTSMTTFESIPSIPVIPVTSAITQQNFPRIAAYGNTVAIVWKQISNGRELVALNLYEDITSSASPVFDTVDLDNIMNVDVALSDKNLFVVWEDYSSGTIKYRQGSYELPTAVEAAEKAINIYAIQNVAEQEWIIKGDDLTDDVQSTMYDIHGKKINVFNGISDHQLTIPNGSLVPGIYILELSKNKRKIALQLIKI